ncbi:hypothetical protein C5167_006565 [Papaver somniferum]|uniref:Uncharacterized protein n=1 Tax=Papaver somniferum TaxID=3469 RepID=A0A4Y7JGV4_PAPSO|nr:hypothetical protein C5167_006565 [Papaver somniferum]
MEMLIAHRYSKNLAKMHQGPIMNMEETHCSLVCLMNSCDGELALTAWVVPDPRRIGSGDISIEGAQNVEGEEANGARESETKDGLTQCVVFEAIEYCVARFAHFSPPEHEILVPSLNKHYSYSYSLLRARLISPKASVQDGEKYVDQLPSAHPDSSTDKSELQKLPDDRKTHPIYPYQ